MMLVFCVRFGHVFSPFFVWLVYGVGRFVFSMLGFFYVVISSGVVWHNISTVTVRVGRIVRAFVSFYIAEYLIWEGRAIGFRDGGTNVSRYVFNEAEVRACPVGVGEDATYVGIFVLRFSLYEAIRYVNGVYAGRLGVGVEDSHTGFFVEDGNGKGEAVEGKFFLWVLS